MHDRKDDGTTISGQLARFIHSTCFEDLPPEVIEQAKSRILDSLCTAISARDLPVPSIALKFVQANRGEATIFAHHQRVPAVDAAFVNATLVNGGTHDDFLQKSHQGAVTVPAATALAEEVGGSGRDLLEAVVVGYDVGARAYMGGPTMLPRFRASGVAGAVAAATAAAKMLKLETSEIAHALGCSTMFASGFGEGFLTGAMDVKLNVGWACRSGVSAAILARHGATAAPRAFEGPSGFFHAFAGTVEHADAAVRDLGKRFLISDTVYKERPVCIFVQTPVQLAWEIAQENRLDPRKIERISIRAPEMTFTNPGYRNVAPFATPLQARISASFCIAAALLGRPLESHEFYYRTSDPEVLALAAKIELLEPSNDTERVYLEVVHDGKTLSKTGIEMDTLRPTLAKVVAKFRRLTADLPATASTQLLDTVLNLESVRQIRELTDQLRFAER